MRIIGKTITFVWAIVIFSLSITAQELKPDEIIAKHLDAIGTKEKRDAVKSLMAIGLSEFESKNPIVKGGGKAVVVSNPENLFFIISLNSRSYPFEKVGYFDGNISLPYISSGQRSLLGDFLTEHKKILSEGLFAGVMSSRWPLLGLDKRKPKMKSAGVKKVDGRKAYALDYFLSGSGSGDFSVRMFFDIETFNHLRTEYRREIAIGQVVFGRSNQQANATITLTEDFSDFRSVDGVTLPYYYRIDYVSNSNTSVYENIWGIKVAEYRVNQALAPDFFTFDQK